MEIHCYSKHGAAVGVGKSAPLSSYASSSGTVMGRIGVTVLCDVWFRCIYKFMDLLFSVMQWWPDVQLTTEFHLKSHSSVWGSGYVQSLCLRFTLTSRVAAALWCKTSKSSADTYVFPLILRFEESLREELGSSQKTQRMQRLRAHWSISVSDGRSWHFTDGGRAASDDASHRLAGRLAFATIP